MFRSTHDKIVKSLRDDYDARINAIKQRANEQEAHDEARVQAERQSVNDLKSELTKMHYREDTISKSHAYELRLMRERIIKANFKRDPRDIADTLVRALHPLNRAALEYPNWDELPEEYRDAFYDIVYKLLGKPRKSKSSTKSTKHSA